MMRRTFLRNTAAGMAAVAGNSLLRLGAQQPEKVKNGDTTMTPEVGRPVRVVSIGFSANTPLHEVARCVDDEGAHSPDVILLPETCRGQNEQSEEPLRGATVTAMAALAKKHNVWIAVPIDRGEGSRRLNTTVFLDRSGQIACTYDKAFPYWSEYDVRPAVSPGREIMVHQTDFGRVGLATCFDVNFPEVWNQLADKGAEIVLWPSAYSAGTSLQAHALNHHYYIVTSTLMSDCIVYDITGERLLYESSKSINVSRISLDLDRSIYHENFNLEKRDRLLKEHPKDVTQEKHLAMEQWFVLKATRPGFSARKLAQQYGLEELRSYIDRSRAAINKLRGAEIAASGMDQHKILG